MHLAASGTDGGRELAKVFQRRRLGRDAAPRRYEGGKDAGERVAAVTTEAAAGSADRRGGGSGHG